MTPACKQPPTAATEMTSTRPAFTPVFIPGLLCTADLFREQVGALRPAWEPVVAETLGLDSIAGMADAALARVNGPVVPIGLSMGGYVAMEMARLAPERLRGLVLLNTACRVDDEERKRQRLAAIEMARSDRFRGVTRHLLATFLAPAALADEGLVQRVLAMAAEVGRDNFVNQQRAIMQRRDQRDTLAGLDVPALVACGDKDTLTPPDVSREMHRLIPDSRLVILEEVGHLSTMEAPHKVSEAIAEFLEEL